MRVLWFTNNPCNYKASGGYHGGGWMSSLQDVIQSYDKEKVELGISFCMDGQPEKEVQEDVTYYPVPSHSKPIKDKILDLIHYKDVSRDEILWQHYVSHFKRVIEDFKPDVIEVFGSELYTGLGAIAAKEMKVPCVLHLQGILSLYIYTFLPTGVSRSSYIKKDGIKGAYSNFQLLTYWKRSCHREKAILRAVNHVIGRTEWDRYALEVLNPDAKYHWGGEILRSCFYEKGERKIPSKPVITTTSSGASYKGFDIVLKTADILKNECGLDFEWNVYGNVEPTFFERLTGINHKDVNVILKGVASAEQLREAMLKSTLYFQPSYIENSPNSVAEAQILGLPVVATNVGGTSSMVEHGETGFLFPVTDPYMAAYYVRCLMQDNNKNIAMGKKGQTVAKQRHDRDTIVKELIETYKKVMTDAK
ncbi:MAG: glycosyltransferase [Prevotella sp.]|nr:glycosyltransferase [Prevotella sp.]